MRGAENDCASDMPEDQRALIRGKWGGPVFMGPSWSLSMARICHLKRGYISPGKHTVKLVYIARMTAMWGRRSWNCGEAGHEYVADWHYRGQNHTITFQSRTPAPIPLLSRRRNSRDRILHLNFFHSPSLSSRHWVRFVRGWYSP